MSAERLSADALTTSLEDPLPSWPAASENNGRVFRLRQHWADFRVTELADALHSPSRESGAASPHTAVWIEKQGLTTLAVVDELARLGDCRPTDVGRFGLKDRHAVTRQWLSVPGSTTHWQQLLAPVQQQLVSDQPGWRALELQPCQRKLKPGGHAGNAFELVLRGIGLDDGLQARIQDLRDYGVPNYFGPQRFGHDGSNLRRALTWLSRSSGQVRRNRSRRSDRGGRGRHLSVLRSLLFNEVLAARVRGGNWHSVVDGDVLIDGEPTGPLWGRGRPSTSADALAIEQAALAPLWIVAQGLEFTGVSQARRPLRFLPCECELEDASDAAGEPAVRLSFQAPAGCFATALLAELGRWSEPPRLAQGRAA